MKICIAFDAHLEHRKKKEGNGSTETVCVAEFQCRMIDLNKMHIIRQTFDIEACGNKICATGKNVCTIFFFIEKLISKMIFVTVVPWIFISHLWHLQNTCDFSFCLDWKQLYAICKKIVSKFYVIHITRINTTLPVLESIRSAGKNQVINKQAIR